MKPSDPVNLACPVCGRSPVTCMVPSEHGAYCGCDFCGHMWQQEGLFFNRPASPFSHLKRRKTDWSGDRRGLADPPPGDRSRRESSGDQPVESTACSHCGRIDERHDHEIKRFMRRIAELESINALLESSARAFGELAERLNQRVRSDRRSGVERRNHQRTTPDRRMWKSLEG